MTQPPPPEDEGKALIPPKIISLADLLAMEFAPLVWTVPGIIARGNCDMIAGRPKMGKSRFSLSVALAIALGGYALGKFKVVQGDVLYLALEDGERRLQARLKQLLQYERGADLSHFYSSFDWTTTDNRGVAFLEQWIDQVDNPTLIVIDTLTRIRPAGDLKRPLMERDYDAIKPLHELAHRRNVGILIVHHTRKAEAEDWLDEVNGSVGLTASTDHTFVLKRKRGKKEAVLHGTGRDLIEEMAHALVSDDATSGWTYAGNADDVQYSEERYVVLGRLEDQYDGMQTGILAGAIGKSAQATWNLLDKLKAEGLVQTTRRGLWQNTIRGSQVLSGVSKNPGVNGVNGVNGGAGGSGLHGQAPSNGVNGAPETEQSTLSGDGFTSITPITPPLSEGDDSDVAF